MKNSCWGKGILALFILLSSFVGKAQQEKIRWLTLSEAERQCREVPKPYLFDFYTDECGDCRQMYKTVYTDPIVVTFVNRHFYPVHINVYSADTVFFRDKMYASVRSGDRFLSGLAVEMLDGKPTWPATVFLHDVVKLKLSASGLLEVDEMRGYLVYLIENAWKSVNIKEFLTDFKFVFGKKIDKTNDSAMPWTVFTDLEQKRKIRKKKILLFLEGSWNNSSRMMEQVLFTDSLFLAEAREHFYCLRLDVQSHDTVTFLTHTFYNAGASYNNLHQLAIALSDKVLRVPGIYFFDEDGKLMESIFYYIGRRKGHLMLDYIGSDLFKSMTWNEYIRVRQRETI